MINRYSKFIEGKLYSYPYFPQKQLTNNLITIYTKLSDRLDILAKKYYDDSSKWWIIAYCNNLDGDSLILPTGTLLQIPINVVYYS